MIVKNVQGVNVTCVNKSFTSANILEVEVGTTGRMGGDSGHGCRTYFSIIDHGSTDLHCTVKKEVGYYGDECEKIEISLGGDCELDTFVAALEYAASYLKAKNKGQSLILDDYEHNFDLYHAGDEPRMV